MLVEGRSISRERVFSSAPQGEKELMMFLIDGPVSRAAARFLPPLRGACISTQLGGRLNTVRHLVLALEHQRLRPRAGARRSA